MFFTLFTSYSILLRIAAEETDPHQISQRMNVRIEVRWQTESYLREQAGFILLLTSIFCFLG